MKVKGIAFLAAIAHTIRFSLSIAIAGHADADGMGGRVVRVVEGEILSKSRQGRYCYFVPTPSLLTKPIRGVDDCRGYDYGRPASPPG